jgi:hypothetical protein
MKAEANESLSESPLPANRRFFGLPATRLGWWAGGLMIAFVILFLINSFVIMPPSTNALFGRSFLIFYGIFMILCGLAAGVVGLVALVRNHERSWLVWVAVMPGAFVLFLLVGEFLVPH